MVAVLKNTSQIRLTTSLIFLTIVSFFHLPWPSDAGSNKILIQSDCVCPGQSLTLTCSVLGLGSTVWQGNMFDCLLSQNEISLLHNNFATSTAEGECNNGDIVARGLSVSGQNCFLSQLTLVPSMSTNGQTVDCFHDDGSTFMSLDRVTVNLTTEPFQAPANVRLTRVSNRELTFTWDAAESSCPSLQYSINSTDCGTCATTSMSNGITCVDYIAASDRLCIFSVQTVVCNVIASVMNASTQVPLKVPDIPAFIKIVPSYSFLNKSLLRLDATFNENSSNFYISDTINGSQTSYNITYLNQDGVNCGSVNVPTASELCRSGICRYIFDISSSGNCLPSNSISVSLTAINVFGYGPMSNNIVIDTNNRLLEVQYDRQSSQIVCTFSEGLPNLPNSTCSIEYAREGTTDSNIQTNQSQALAPDGIMITQQIEIYLQGLFRSTTYNFVVTATSGNTTINVEGSFFIAGDSSATSLLSPTIAAIAISIIIAVLTVLL